MGEINLKVKKFVKLLYLVLISSIMTTMFSINGMSYYKLTYHHSTEYGIDKYYNFNSNGIYYNIDLYGKDKGKEIYNVQAFYPIINGDVLKIPDKIILKGKKYKVKDVSLDPRCEASYITDYDLPKLTGKLVLPYKTIYLPKYATNFNISSDVKLPNIKKIYVSKKIKDLIGFSDMQNVKVIIDKENPYIKMKNDALYSKNGKTLIRLVNKKKVYKVAKGTKKIELTGFDCVKSIEKLYLPASMKKISDGAFDRCKKLKMVKINNKTTKIGDFAFEKCKSLKKISMPNNLERIGKSAFLDCISLKKIVMPTNVNIIEFRAFKNCSELSKVIIESEEKAPVIEKASFKNTKDGIQFVVKNQTIADQLKEQLTSSGVRNAKILIGKNVVYQNING